MTRRDILQSIRQIKQDPELAGLNPTDGEAMVIYVTETNRATVEYIMSEFAKAIDSDPRTNFIYAFLTAAWQAMNEFTTTFGNYLKQRNNKKKG
jgi:tRNA threonylcarbamoyladenosine modification (KEOPS) complex Cgi121 subunit